VVATHLKNVSQIGSFPQVEVKKNKMKPPPRVWIPLCITVKSWENQNAVPWVAPAGLGQGEGTTR